MIFTTLFGMSVFLSDRSCSMPGIWHLASDIFIVLLIISVYRPIPGDSGSKRGSILWANTCSSRSQLYLFFTLYPPARLISILALEGLRPAFCTMHVNYLSGRGRNGIWATPTLSQFHNTFYCLSWIIFTVVTVFTSFVIPSAYHPIPGDSGSKRGSILWANTCSSRLDSYIKYIIKNVKFKVKNVLWTTYIDSKRFSL